MVEEECRGGGGGGGDVAVAGGGGGGGGGGPSHLHLHPERAGAGEVADVQREEVVERSNDRGEEIVAPERQPRAAGAARHRRLSRDEREQYAALPLPRVRPREQHRVRGAVEEKLMLSGAWRTWAASPQLRRKRRARWSRADRFAFSRASSLIAPSVSSKRADTAESERSSVAATRLPPFFFSARSRSRSRSMRGVATPPPPPFFADAAPFDVNQPFFFLLPLAR